MIPQMTGVLTSLAPVQSVRGRWATAANHLKPAQHWEPLRREEKEQCERMHRLIEELHLDGDLRWLVAQKNRVRNGELYRLIADSHGAFVQPALYEAFGLTVR